VSPSGPAFYRDLWGPKHDPNDRYPMSGDDCLAVKRVLSRAGFLEWGAFTRTYGENAEKACADFQRTIGVHATGHYGKPTHEALRGIERKSHPGEPAWDDHSIKLYKGAIVEPHPSLAFKRDLWGPTYDPNKRYPMSGDDCLAVKRALSRTGSVLLPWGDFTSTYGQDAEKACAKFQRTAGIQATGHYGGLTHSALLRTKAAGKHEWAWDDYSVKLYRNYTPPSAGAAGARRKAMDHQAKRVGYTEQPADSNFDHRLDGIRTSQRHTAGGGTWLDRKAWCGCWCYYALETARVKGIDYSLASVEQIEDNAKASKKCFRGWTTDRAKIKPGDLVVVGGYGVHVEMVRGPAQSDGGVPTYGGNTSPGTSGSQSNGGGAYKRVRYPGEVRGFALVRFPGE
jgi:peptidoglycan hydrolase-like protein with peptidoglycan-binding domain